MNSGREISGLVHRFAYDQADDRSLENRCVRPEVTLNNLFISSFVTSFLIVHTKSVNDPSGTGTLSAIPSSFPFKCGMTSATAFAAPVEVGTVLTAACLALLKSLCGASTNL